MSINDWPKYVTSMSSWEIYDKMHNTVCRQCGKSFYPLQSSCFCSKSCAQLACKETLSVPQIDADVALEMLSSLTDDITIDQVREIARRATYQQHGILFGDIKCVGPKDQDAIRCLKNTYRMN